MQLLDALLNIAFYDIMSGDPLDSSSKEPEELESEEEPYLALQ